MGQSGKCFGHDLTDAGFGLTDGRFGLMGVEAGSRESPACRRQGSRNLVKSPSSGFKFKSKFQTQKIQI